METLDSKYSFSLKPQAEWFFVIAASLLSVFLRYLALNSTPYGTGPDAYFFVEQTRNLVENLAMPFADLSLVYIPFVFFGAITEDYLLSIKLGSALLSGLFLFTLYLAARGNTKKHLVPLVLLAFGLFSPVITFITGHYPKAMMGLVGMNLFITAIGTKDVRWVMPTFVLNQLIYAFTGWIVFIVFIFFLLSRKKYQWLPVAFLVMVVSVIIIPHFFTIYSIRGNHDELAIGLTFPPWRYISYVGYSSFSFLGAIECIFMLAVLGFGLLVSLSGRLDDHPQRRMFFYLTAVGIILLFPVYNTESQRIGLTGALLTAFCIPLLILPLREANYKLKLGMIFVLTGLSLFSWKSYRPGALNIEYSEYDVLLKKLNSELGEKKPEMLIAKYPLAYFIVHHAKIRSRPWIDEVEFYSPGSLLRLTSGIEKKDITPLQKSVESGYLKEIVPGYLLWDEGYWKVIKNIIKVEGILDLEMIIESEDNPGATEEMFRENEFLLVP